MNYLLDTNVCIRFLTGRSTSIKNKIKNIDLSSLFICSAVRGELEYGARKSNNPEKSITVLKDFLSNFQEVNFDTIAAEHYGIIRAALEKQGLPIGPYDLQIASIALAHNFALVSHNTGEFSRIPHLQLEDWE